MKRLVCSPPAAQLILLPGAQDHSSYGRSLRWLGVGMVVCGLIELLCAGTGLRPLLGPAGLRKSIVFFISTGLTVWSLGCLRAVRVRCTWDAWLDGMLGAALSVEVILISLQSWLGRPSHFNHATMGDAMIERTMLACIVAASLVILCDTIRCLRPMALDRPMALAYRAGMLFLCASCGLGFIISAVGWSRLAAGASPETFGKAGVLKFPHGAAIHALQMLPLVAWVASFSRRRYATGLVVAAIVGQFLWLFYAVRQTVLGLARFDMDAGEAWLLGALALSIMGALGLAVYSREERASVSD
ncbi:MAG: hypothetical protein ACOYMN_03940 [Roseimicrobium sp.]